MREPVKVIDYKGYKINVYSDDTSESPDRWGDNSLFLVGYHRDFWVDRGQRELVTIFKKEEFKKDNGYDGRVYADGYGWKSYKEAKKEGLVNKQVRRGKYVPGISKELAIRIAEGGKYDDGSKDWEASDYIKNYHIFPLEAYIHSGVRLYLSGGCYVDRQWDVSQVGMIFVSKEECRLRNSAKKLALGLIEEWNDYLSGNVYGYMIEDTFEEESGGCWGFYGDYEKSGLIEEAKGEIEQALKEDKKLKHIAIGSLA